MSAVKEEMKILGVDENSLRGGLVKNATSIHDFEILKPISKGAYGRVFLAQKKTTKDIYAIKVLKREEMITSRQRDNILLEVSFPSFLPSFFFIFLSSFFLTHSLFLSLSSRISGIS